MNLLSERKLNFRQTPAEVNVFQEFKFSISQWKPNINIKTQIFAHWHGRQSVLRLEHHGIRGQFSGKMIF